MCRQVRCDVCGKATFAGCGLHVEQVLAGVPQQERCDCASRAPAGRSGESAEAEKPRWWKLW